MVSILNQFNPIHQPSFPRIYFNIILLPTSMSSEWSVALRQSFPNFGPQGGGGVTCLEGASCLYEGYIYIYIYILNEI
jgi:hypothetical protein